MVGGGCSASWLPWDGGGAGGGVARGGVARGGLAENEEGRRSAGGGGTSGGAGAGGKVALVTWRGFEQEVEDGVVGFGVVRRACGMEGR